jgi:hypothetical protein
MIALVDGMYDKDLDCTYAISAGESLGFDPITHDAYVSIIEARKSKVAVSDPTVAAGSGTPGPAYFFSRRPAMADTATPTVSEAQMHDAYLALVKRRRLYSGLMLLIFVVLMVSGFNTADGAQRGSFWGGIGQFFDYPAEVVSEAPQGRPAARPSRHLLSRADRDDQHRRGRHADRAIRGDRLFAARHPRAGALSAADPGVSAGSWTSCARSPRSSSRWC